MAAPAAASGWRDSKPWRRGPALDGSAARGPTVCSEPAGRKEAFLKGGLRNPEFQEACRCLPPYQVMAGTVIPAALVTGIQSDLPGDVDRHGDGAGLFDTATGRYLLIPQGSRILGRYNSQGELWAEPGADGVEPHRPAGYLVAHARQPRGHRSGGARWTGGWGGLALGAGCSGGGADDLARGGRRAGRPESRTAIAS